VRRRLRVVPETSRLLHLTGTIEVPLGKFEDL
jgi:hypothetical protein